MSACASMSRPSAVSGGGRWLRACVLALMPVLASAQCPQIKSWSNQDSSYFPVERLTRISHENTPGAFYVDLDNVRERTLLVTFVSLAASPSLTRDQAFGNNFQISLSSFASAADASAMFGREIANYNAINPVRWGYTTLFTEAGVAAWYADAPDSKYIDSIALRLNTVIRITLRSSSRTDNVHQRGTSELATRLQRARDLVDAKCGVKPENRPPTIGLSLPAVGNLSSATAFQDEMAAGRIAIRATDPDGLEDLDWSSFRLFVSGVDKTGHALQVVNLLAREGRVSRKATPSEPNAETYELRVDPKRLMGEHNLFNIAWNGSWPVKLQICDRKGACGSSEQSLFFGPYLSLSDLSGFSCLQPNVIKVDAGWGNNGYPATSNFYVVMGRANSSWQSWTSEYFTLSMGLPPLDALQWFDWTYGMRPVFLETPVFLATGARQERFVLDLPVVARDARRAEFRLPSGQHTLAFGAFDQDSGASRAEQYQMAVCAARP